MTLARRIVAASIFSCAFLVIGCGSGSSAAPPPPTFSASCTVNGSSSPAPVLVTSFVSYNANPAGGAGPYTCDWNPGSPLPGAFDLPAGSSCAPGSPTYTAVSGGTYSENVIASDSGGHTVSRACPALTVQDFGISVVPPSASSFPGGVVAYTVTASSVNGFTGEITFGQDTSLPSGISATWDPAHPVCTIPAGGSCSAIYTVTVGTGAAAGDTGLVFVGTYAPIPGFTRVANATLHVQPSGGTADKFAYVVNVACSSSGCVDIYTIDSATGALTSAGSELAGIGSEVLAADPMGKFLYVADPSNISMFTIDASTGKLTPTIPPTVPGGLPEWIGVHPSGKFAYLANDDDTAIDVFAIDSTTGVLAKTSSATACINSLRIPGVSVGLDPSGKFAYVPRVCSFDDILTFSINQSNGALTQSGSPASGSPLPVGLTVHPSGKFAYLVSSSPDIVTVYSVNSTSGQLTPTSTANTGSLPSAIAIGPAGKFGYVTNSGDNNVSEYSIDQTTGALTHLGDASGVNAPVGMTIEHSGKFLYVVNGQDGCSLGGLGSTVQPFTIGATGLLTPGTKVCADIMATQMVTTSPSP